MKKLLVTNEIFTRGVEDVVTKEELEGLLRAGKRLRIKHGVDATAPDLHIGHAANLWKLRALQEAGHKAVIILGDVTTEIGDPTGKSKTRPVLSAAEIRKNVAKIKKQVLDILINSPKLLEVRKSSEWYGPMKARDIIKLLSMVTHARLIERDMFQSRIAKGEEIHMHEIMYPILQGYDSTVVRADLTIIGSDQLFNEHMGRFFQERFAMRPQVIVALGLLPGLDGGEKMSKSLGNYIGLADTPGDKFGKAMRIRDDLIIPYLEAYTDVPMEKIRDIAGETVRGANPRDAKLFFAESLVARYHGSSVAKKERERFLQIFSRKELGGIPSVKLSPGRYQILDLILNLKFASSRSEARRLVDQGAVEVGGHVIRDPKGEVEIASNVIVKVGKRRFAKIT